LKRRVFYFEWIGKIEGYPENSENLKRAVFLVFSERIKENFRKFPASLKGKNKTLKNNLKLFRIIFLTSKKTQNKEKSGKQN
jgi:hypothetical protein